MKIKSITKVGIRQTYNIEMASRHHNYVLQPENGQPVHKNSHSTSYIMQAYLTAWFKIHFPPEWWASVMSACHPDKRVKYMNVARSEGVHFGAINVEDISVNFTVDPGTLMITPGLTSIKGIGEKAAEKIQERGTYENIDDFVAINGKDKTILQRLILLGAFERYHPNIRATWMWYQFKYCSGVTELKNEIKGLLLADWTPEKIAAEIERQSIEFKALYPKRKIPPKILKWKPKAKEEREAVMALFPEDYTLREKRDFEKEYLGYYWHSPMDLYHVTPDATIKAAKSGDSVAICCEIDKVWKGKTKKEKPFARYTLTDGLNTCTLLVWENELIQYGEYLTERSGVKVYVDYDHERDTFTLQRRSGAVVKMMTMAEYRKQIAEEGYEVELV